MAVDLANKEYAWVFRIISEFGLFLSVIISVGYFHHWLSAAEEHEESVSSLREVLQKYVDSILLNSVKRGFSGITNKEFDFSQIMQGLKPGDYVYWLITFDPRFKNKSRELENAIKNGVHFRLLILKSDCIFGEVPKQRNSREENAQILDQTIDADGNKRAVYADSAYRSEAQEQRLVDAEIESQVCEKGTRGKPLTDEQKLSNRTKSKVRARVEHVFGAQSAMGGHVVRTIGLQRAIVKIGLMNLVYNMKRLIQLINRDANAAKRDLMNQRREGTPLVA